MGVPNMLQKSISKLGCDGGITMVKPVAYLGKPIGWVDHLEMETFSIWGSESVFFFGGNGVPKIGNVFRGYRKGPPKHTQIYRKWVHNWT
jgi:hypothetical protein